MKVALYYRVSTPDQSNEPQRVELLAYCDRRGWQDPREYADKISGAKFTRFGLDGLMGDVRKGKVDVVLCVKLDRLGRSLSHLAQLIAELDKHRTALICTSQPVDTSEDNPAGRLTMGILCCIAEFERTLIVDRTKAGLAVARANGKQLGRPGFRMTSAKATMLAVWKAGQPREPLRVLASALGCSMGMAHRLSKGN